MNIMDRIAYLLLIIGGLNWGLVGAFEFNLVGELFGVESVLSRLIYIVVGIAALYGIYSLFASTTTTERATHTTVPDRR